MGKEDCISSRDWSTAVLHFRHADTKGACTVSLRTLLLLLVRILATILASRKSFDGQRGWKSPALAGTVSFDHRGLSDHVIMGS